MREVRAKILADPMLKQDDELSHLQAGRGDETVPLLPPAKKRRLPLSKILKALGTAVCIALIVASCEWLASQGLERELAVS